MSLGYYVIMPEGLGMVQIGIMVHPRVKQRSDSGMVFRRVYADGQPAYHLPLNAATGYFLRFFSSLALTQELSSSPSVLHRLIV